MDQTTYLGAPAGEVQSTAFAYDGNGNVRTITETSSGGTRVETRDYDDFDRLTDAVDGDGRALHYAYDDVGNRTRLTDPDGHDTVWTYNALNQNTRVAVPGLGTTTLGYAPSGRLTAITRPDGSLTEHTYFDNGRLQSLRHSKAGATLARYDYVYDPNGNRTEQRELNGATTDDEIQSTRYVYDDADRLVEVKEPNRTTSYTPDPVGNRVHEAVVDGNNTPISQSTLAYNNRDQLTNRSDPVAGVNVVQTWDSNGNLATQTVNGQQPRIYSYDARDRLVGLTLPTSPTGPATLAFAYHPDGLRREKTDGVTTTRYHYDGQSLFAETNAIGNTLRQFHYSTTQLIAQTQAGTTPTYRHVLLDALRSPIALLDPAGLITARTSYDAFGEIRAQLGTTGALTTPNRNAANAELVATDNQPIGFTGYLKDTESGLYYAKARYYDPATARFTIEDPEAGKDLEPPSLHRYLYAYANPTAYLDETGRQAFLEQFFGTNPLWKDGDTQRQAGDIGPAFWNAHPKTGVTAGVLSRTGEYLAAPIAIAADLESGKNGDIEATRRTLERGRAIYSELQDNALATALGGGFGAGLKYNLAFVKGVYSHVTGLANNIDKGNAFQIGEGLVDVGSDATALLGITGAVKGALTRTVGTVVETTSGGTALKLERRIAINPENDFIGDQIPHPVKQPSNESIRQTLPGMSRPVRPINASHPPNADAILAMDSSEIRKMASNLECVDCNEIAERMKNLSGGKGSILEVRPTKRGNINVYEGGEIAEGQYYHQVYTDSRYIFDPRISNTPVPIGDWRKHMRKINPEGIEISNKPRGLQ